MLMRRHQQRLEQEGPMSSEHAIQRLGFQKWYERELMYSHANLVLLLLCTIGLLASAEVYEPSAPLMDQLKVLAAAAVSAAIGVLSLRRYLYRLKHAEFVADQAVCKACDVYGRLQVLGGGDDSAGLSVKCRHCGHRWTLKL
jgi:DNA-directed RNA polymerase subunit RPC12/RpoP